MISTYRFLILYSDRRPPDMFERTLKQSEVPSCISDITSTRSNLERIDVFEKVNNLWKRRSSNALS